MKLIVNFDGEKETKEIDSIDVLKDELLEFAGYFIPEDDTYAFELLEKNYFDELIDELEEYYVKSFFEIAKEFFLTIKRIYEIDTINDIKNELDTLNTLFDKAGVNVIYSIE